MRNLILEILMDDREGQEAAQSFGLDSSDEGARIEVHALRMAQRFKPEGTPVMQAIMEVTQSRTLPVDPANEAKGTFEFIGGCTLVIDLKEPRLDYVVVKNINAPNRIQRTRDYLMSRAAMGMSAYAAQEPFGFLHGGRP